MSHPRHLLPIAILTCILPLCSLHAATGYLVHNLVADTAGVADFTDPNLVNAWGIAISGASPFWLCDGGTGLSTVYAAGATRVLGQRHQGHHSSVRDRRQHGVHGHRLQQLDGVHGRDHHAPAGELHFLDRGRHHLRLGQRRGRHARADGRR